MNTEAERLVQQVRTARLARLSAQRARLLAAQRAEQLERKLTHAAQSGLRAEIARTLDARARLQAVAKRKAAARYAGFAAFVLLLGVASLGMGLARPQNAAVPAQFALRPSVLDTAPGDRLNLAFSYSVSLPAAR